MLDRTDGKSLRSGFLRHAALRPDAPAVTVRGVTRFLGDDSGEEMAIYDAEMKYAESDTRSVHLRGLPGKYASVTFDGVHVSSTGLASATRSKQGPQRSMCATTACVSASSTWTCVPCVTKRWRSAASNPR